jgi:hypothetical protein
MNASLEIGSARRTGHRWSNWYRWTKGEVSLKRNISKNSRVAHRVIKVLSVRLVWMDLRERKVSFVLLSVMVEKNRSFHLGDKGDVGAKGVQGETGPQVRRCSSLQLQQAVSRYCVGTER